MDKTREQVHQFIDELTELTHKYGIVIGACGCCGSPYLKDEYATGEYVITEHDGDFDQLEYYLYERVQ